MPRRGLSTRFKLGPKAMRARSKFMRNRMRRGRTGIKQPVQYFKRVVYEETAILNNTVTDTIQSLTFSLDKVTNHTEFTALYDQYQIKGVKFTLIPKFSETIINDNVPPTWSILDYDGSPPTNRTAMVQYQNLKTVPGNKWHSRYLKPAIAAAVYNGITTGYGERKNVWLDCNNDAIPHYGATVLLPPVVNGPFSYDLKTTYYLAFKNVR